MKRPPWWVTAAIAGAWWGFLYLAALVILLTAQDGIMDH